VGGEVEEGGQTRFVTKREIGNFNALMDMYVIELAELMLGCLTPFYRACQPVKKRTMVKQVSGPQLSEEFLQLLPKWAKLDEKAPSFQI
jgi:hypothetical protein